MGPLGKEVNDRILLHMRLSQSHVVSFYINNYIF